ncbi:MAG: hypothetical protein G01um101418_789 [Parcubacteria group bacterium Gr01-1014_18]|nr:MAG: hypothetical protein Greene041636_671 [Parcubacteria group bacterium Greene0416_36]TSC80091.1 MAG: hypothetical protein G01um101418_789 [Parcubacteria group bacterium Gr01-1014_18]TSC98619.1 MAG: hypothetical protein Greene101420_671 [Parcubacteria group bacterium Greene1014_20]TSD06446.1 MAG: hypothetical protein Greene07142_937 [Parcubacteria group bacterium Greene0714_2]
MFLNLRLVSIGIGIIAIAALAGCFYYYQEAQALKKDPALAARQEAQKTLARVGQILYLPKEEPQIASINDPEKLKDNPFFAESQKGDKLLMYKEAKRAILYDPIAHKIRDIAPWNPDVPTDKQELPN